MDDLLIAPQNATLGFLERTTVSKHWLPSPSLQVETFDLRASGVDPVSTLIE